MVRAGECSETNPEVHEITWRLDQKCGGPSIASLNFHSTTEEPVFDATAAATLPRAGGGKSMFRVGKDRVRFSRIAKASRRGDALAALLVGGLIAAKALDPGASSDLGLTELRDKTPTITSVATGQGTTFFTNLVPDRVAQRITNDVRRPLFLASLGGCLLLAGLLLPRFKRIALFSVGGPVNELLQVARSLARLPHQLELRCAPRAARSPFTSVHNALSLSSVRRIVPPYDPQGGGAGLR